MKNDNAFKIFIILVVAILFRLWFLDKPEGLWNDEYVSWYIATKTNISEFISDMLKNCHTPLYYLYIKFWLLFFPDTDLSLRASSVVPSLLTVLTMYFTGKEFKNANTGLLCAFLTAISSFNIYFAQEVRLYSLLMFFCSISLLYFIKITKKQSKLNFIVFFAANTLICAVHTLGIIYAFYNILFLMIYLYKYEEEYKNKLYKFVDIIKYVCPFLIVLALLVPFWYTIAFSKSLSQFWSGFSGSKIFYTFIDYLSPVQINIINTPNDIVPFALTPVFFIFGILSLIIGFYAIYNAIKEKNPVLNYILLSSLAFFTVLILISLTGKMVFITKYSCEIYPSIILALAFGFSILDKKRILTVIFIVLNLFYLITSNDSAPKRGREEGNFAAVSLLKYSSLKSTDTVILTYYDLDKFERYLNSKNDYNFSSINKFNFNNFMFDNPDYFQTIKLGKSIYRDYFRNFPNNSLLDKIWDTYLRKMKKGDKIGFVFLDNVSFLSNNYIQDIVDDDIEYKKTPFIFLVFSTLRNNLLYSMKDHFKMVSITQAGKWTLFVFEKK